MTDYRSIFKHYPDYPKPGVDFIDLMPLLQDKAVFNGLMNELAGTVHCPNVATIEARGFLFAAPLLVKSPLVQNIIPIRKKGKLPYNEGDLRSVEIEKEYGSDEVFYRLSDIAAGVPEGDTFNITLMDDLLATGGTAMSIAESLNRERIVVEGKEYRVKVNEFLFVVELPFLQGRGRLDSIAPVRSLVSLD